MNAPQALTLGLALGSVGYGVASVLFFMSAYLLTKTMKIGTLPKTQSRVLLIYIIVLFICSTLVFISTVYTSWNFWVSVGPNWDFGEKLVFGRIEETVVFLANEMADGLMVWRCIVLYHESERKSRIIAGMLICMLVSSIGEFSVASCSS
ncbi:hypothetical protein BDQ12DRAFT_728184 [Crucibulum laeve]|uniref:Uncharacterized protein n=1 Tax=Crucibulum laeve TaxID=68775 RepID=A0A5C3LJR7_9AGAR|nr:hypothetical protein BDQ12DRAFT_728184 [Crucibulum laeve]